MNPRSRSAIRPCRSSIMEVGMSQLPDLHTSRLFPPEDDSADVRSTSIHNAPLPDVASPTQTAAQVAVYWSQQSLPSSCCCSKMPPACGARGTQQWCRQWLSGAHGDRASCSCIRKYQLKYSSRLLDSSAKRSIRNSRRARTRGAIYRLR